MVYIHWCYLTFLVSYYLNTRPIPSVWLTLYDQFWQWIVNANDLSNIWLELLNIGMRPSKDLFCSVTLIGNVFGSDNFNQLSPKVKSNYSKAPSLSVTNILYKCIH